jgi:hypothetical protein
MTECSSTATSQPVDELDRIGMYPFESRLNSSMITQQSSNHNTGSVGILIANNEAKIVDEAGNGKLL